MPTTINYGNITSTSQITPTENQSSGNLPSADVNVVQCNGPCCTKDLDLTAWLEGLPLDCTDACRSSNPNDTIALYSSTNTAATAGQSSTYANQNFCPVLECSYGPAAYIPSSTRVSPLPLSNQSNGQPTATQPYHEALRIPQAQGLATTKVSFGLPTPVAPTFPTTLPSSSSSQEPRRPAPWASGPSVFPACAIGIEHEALDLSLRILQQWHPIVMQSQRADLLQQLWDMENSVSKFAAMLFELRMQDWNKL